MNHLTLKLIKEHLNLDNDFTLDDAYLSNLGDVVEQVVERHIDDSFVYLANANHGKLPTPLIQAMLLLLATYYANREHIAFNANYEVGNSYTFLIDLYRNYSASHSDSSNYTLINSIDELMRKNKEMNDKLEEMKNKNSEIETTIGYSFQDIYQSIDNVKNKIDNNTNEIVRLNGDLSSIMGTVSSVESDMNNTKADVTTLQTSYEEMHGDVTDLKTKVDDLNNKTLQGSESVEVTEDGNTTTLEVNQINGGKF
jgi:DNA packaging protein, QLRG family|nr:MAG TPA: Head Tail Connector Protein [Caudoviricetes sp.]DAI03578.1 MAG TPA: Head Tail Connector Protein [Caudoviricetes sp.]